jgi:cation:H+ antiporter
MAGWRIAGLILVGLGAHGGRMAAGDRGHGHRAGLGMSETVIGLTVVAVGTSLPELATSVVAARRGEAGLALGNILGSNVFNIFAILGLTALLIPIPVPPGLTPDLAFFAGIGADRSCVPVIGRIGRGWGLGMLALYAGYIGWLAVGSA